MVNSKATFKSKSLHLLIRNIVAIKNLSQQSVQALIFCRILRLLYLEICSEVFVLWIVPCPVSRLRIICVFNAHKKIKAVM